MNDWVSIQDAAVYLQVSDRTIRRYLDAGWLQGQRMGPRLIRVSRPSLEAFGRALVKA